MVNIPKKACRVNEEWLIGCSVRWGAGGGRMRRADGVTAARWVARGAAESLREAASIARGRPSLAPPSPLASRSSAAPAAPAFRNATAA